MNKSDLVNAIALGANLNKNVAAKAWDAAVKFIGENLAEGHDVSLAGFGTFTRRHRSARTVKNPRTREPMLVAASVVPNFRPAKNLKELVSVSADVEASDLVEHA